MDYFCDVTLKPDPDFVPAVLLNALFSKLHRALALQPNLSVGVSFPQYSLKPMTLGSKLRLHGTRSDLDSLFQQDWLTGMKDYIDCSEVAAIPQQHQHIRVRRVQAKSNPERLARRYAKRHGIDLDDARQKYQRMKPVKLHFPFLSLNSQSTGQRFTLFINQENILQYALPGEFNRYGLSQDATVPWF